MRALSLRSERILNLLYRMAGHPLLVEEAIRHTPGDPPDIEDVMHYILEHRDTWHAGEEPVDEDEEAERCNSDGCTKIATRFRHDREDAPYVVTDARCERCFASCTREAIAHLSYWYPEMLAPRKTLASSKG